MGWEDIISSYMQLLTALFSRSKYVTMTRILDRDATVSCIAGTQAPKKLRTSRIDTYDKICGKFY